MIRYDTRRYSLQCMRFLGILHSREPSGLRSSEARGTRYSGLNRPSKTLKIKEMDRYEIEKRKLFIAMCVDRPMLKHFFTVILDRADFWLRAEAYKDLCV